VITFEVAPGLVAATANAALGADRRRHDDDLAGGDVVASADGRDEERRSAPAVPAALRGLVLACERRDPAGILRERCGDLITAAAVEPATVEPLERGEQTREIGRLAVRACARPAAAAA
jgi:hypothetical protein